jgi:gas vesicle protein
MHNQNGHHTRSGLQGFLSGVLIGGAIGATVTLLTAPQAGRKTRAQIRQKTLELRDQAVETVDEARQQAEEAMWQARLKARQLKRSAGTTVKELQHRGQTLLEEQKDRVESVLEALQPAEKDGRS